MRLVVSCGNAEFRTLRYLRTYWRGKLVFGIPGNDIACKTRTTRRQHGGVVFRSSESRTVRPLKRKKKTRENPYYRSSKRSSRPDKVPIVTEMKSVGLNGYYW